MSSFSTVKWINKTIVFLLCAYFVTGLLLLYIGQLFWGFCYDQQHALNNVYLLPFVAVLTALLIALAAPTDDRLQKPRDRLLHNLRIAQVCFLLLQFVWVYFTRFLPICEATDCYASAYALATGAPVPDADFFRIYLHNSPNALLTSYIIRLALFLNLEPMTMFPYLGAVILNCTVYLTCRVVLELTGNARILWIAFGLGNVWIGLSQFMMQPYSDVYCVVFPVLALWVLPRRISSFWKWFWFTFFCSIGGAIRPTAFILWIAYALYRLGEALVQRTPFTLWLKRGALILLACVLAYVPALCWQNNAAIALAGELNPPERFTITHYLMMGMNYKTFGEISAVDYNDSRNCATVEERQAANLQTIGKRIRSLSLRQAVKFFLIKLYKPLADGNFFADGPYCASVPERNDPISPALRELYLKDGETHVYYASFQQILWLTILGLACVAAFTARRQPPLFFVIGLAVFGLAAYNLLGENWPRYTFIFAPLYLILGMLGLATFPQLRKGGVKSRSPAKEA